MSHIVRVILVLVALPAAFHVQAQTCSPVQSVGNSIQVEGSCRTDEIGRLFCDPDTPVKFTYPWVLQNPALPSCVNLSWNFQDGAGTVLTSSNTIERTFAFGAYTVSALIENDTTTARIKGVYAMRGYYYWPYDLFGAAGSFRENEGPATLTIARNDARFRSTIRYSTLVDPYIAPANGTVTFEAGELTKTISLPLFDDAVWTGNRDEFVAIEGPTDGYVILDSGLRLTTGSVLVHFIVIENDTPTVHQCAPTAYSIPETAGSANITMVRSGNLFVASTGTIDVGRTEAGYSGPRHFEIAFAPGETTKTAALPVTNDAYYSVSQLRTLECNGFVDDVGVPGVSNAAFLEIVDDEPFPTIAGANLDVTETDGTITGALPFTITPPFAASTSIDVFPLFGPHGLSMKGVRVAGGSASAAAAFELAGDDKFELDEVVTVSFRVGGTNAGSATITIHDDDAPPYGYAFGAASHTIAENAPSVTLHRTGDTSTASVAKVRMNGDDSRIPDKSFNVSFAAGETSKTVLLPIENDSWFTGERSATITVRHDEVEMATTRVTVQDDEPMPVFSIDDLVIEEGKNAFVTLSLSGPAGMPLNVQLAMQDGTAVRDLDYRGNSGSVSFEPGRLVLTRSVSALSDFIAEPDETFTITISGCCGGLATPGKTTSVVTIKDADPPAFLKFDRPLVNPLREAQGWLTVTLVRSGNLSKTTTATVRDCCGIFALLTPVSTVFQPGETLKAVSLWIDDDVYSGEDRFIQLELLMDGVKVDDASVTAEENEPTPVFRIEDAWISEGNSGTREAVFTISILPADVLPITMQVSTSAGTAEAGVDFESRTELLQFATRQKTHTFRVPILGDTEPESDETFSVELIVVNHFRGVMGKRTATGTIVDDDRVSATMSPSSVKLVKGTTADLLIEFHQPLQTAGVIHLASSDPAVISVPASVDVAAGEKSVFFTATAHDEGFARVTATLPSNGGTLFSDLIGHELRAPSVRPQALTLERGTITELEITALPGARTAIEVKITPRDGTIANVQRTAVLPAGAYVRVPVFAIAPGATMIDIVFPNEISSATVSVPVKVNDPAPPPSGPKKRRATRH